MLPAGTFKSFFEPVSKTNGATASGFIDRLGYDSLNMAFVLSGADVTTNKPSVMKLQHGDTTAITSASDMTGAVGGTSFTVGNQITAGAGSSVHQINVDLRGKKRYIFAVVSPVTTQICSAAGYLGRAKEAPINATDAGTQNFVAI